MSGGQWYVEPAMGDIIESPGSEVHGVAILLDKEAEAMMDRQEGAGFVYRKQPVELEAYDGRKLQGRNSYKLRTGLIGYSDTQGARRKRHSKQRLFTS